MWIVVDHVCRPKNVTKHWDVLMHQTVKMVFVDPISVKVSSGIRERGEVQVSQI